MNDSNAPDDIELDCPYCESMVACRETDDLVTCPHCGGKSRQTSDYLDEHDDVIFALVPIDAAREDRPR